jgi:hypothetical protein
MICHICQAVSFDATPKGIEREETHRCHGTALIGRRGHSGNAYLCQCRRDGERIPDLFLNTEKTFPLMGKLGRTVFGRVKCYSSKHHNQITRTEVWFLSFSVKSTCILSFVAECISSTTDLMALRSNSILCLYKSGLVKRTAS